MKIDPLDDVRLKGFEKNEEEGRRNVGGGFTRVVTGGRVCSFVGGDRVGEVGRVDLGGGGGGSEFFRGAGASEVKYLLLDTGGAFRGVGDDG